MTTIKRVGAKSVARVLGIMYVILGTLFGLIFFILSLFPRLTGEPQLPIGEAAVMFVLFAVGYGLMGWIGGYASTWLYNAIAHRFGGIEMELEEKASHADTPKTVV